MAPSLRTIRDRLGPFDDETAPALIRKLMVNPELWREVARDFPVTCASVFKWERSLYSFPEDEQAALRVIECLLGGACGIEGWALETGDLRDGVSYINMGDVYSQTVFLRHRNGGYAWRVSDLASLPSTWQNNND